MSHLRDPLSFYRETITPEYVSGLLGAAGVCPRAGIFTATTVVWLMIAQRMNPNRTLAEAVESLRLKRESELLDLVSGSSRARARRVSAGTGGYSQARKRIPFEVVAQVADQLNSSILSFHQSRVKSAQDIFVIDGSTLQVAHTPDNLAEYPQYLNQHGKAHYPLVRFCVATHAETGIIARPSFGPYNGPEAVSELQLADAVLSRLPEGATVLADRYFGCFRFVQAAQAEGLHVICRMKIQNAASVIGHLPTGIGEAEVLWTPSKAELKKYPTLAESKVRGKFVWCPLAEKGKTKEMLVLFTTTDLPLREVVKLYGRRWLVETDLRDLKSTLKMNFIDAKSPEMIAKEIVLGSCAYNLIRHVIGLAAAAAKMNARKFSFTAAIRRIHAVASSALANMSQEQLHRILNTALTDLRGLALPIRGSPRKSEPRKVWPRGAISTMTQSREIERKNVPKRKKPMSKREDEA